VGEGAADGLGEAAGLGEAEALGEGVGAAACWPSQASARPATTASKKVSALTL